MVSHDPGIRASDGSIRLATINGHPAEAIPMATVREDDVEVQLAANGWMRDVLTAHGIPIPPPMLADLTGSTTRLRAAIKR